MSGVWVLVENRDGAVSTISREAIGAARTVADGLGQPLTGLVFGQTVAGVATEAFSLGVDAVIGADDATLAGGRVEAVGPLLVKLARERQPSVILIGASTRGRDLAAWTAADLDTGLVAEAIDLRVESGVVKATRPVYTGKLLAEAFVTGTPQIVTLRGRAFAQAAPSSKTGSDRFASWPAC